MLGERFVGAAERNASVVVPFTCLGEVWRTLTEPRGYGMPPDEIEFALRRLLRSFAPIFPNQGAVRRWLGLASQHRARGAGTFDFLIIAICLEHRVDELWTFDREFPAVDGLRVINPLA